MKKLLIPLLLFGIVVLFTRTSCNKDDDATCDDTEEAPIERAFTLSIIIKYQDNVPYQGNLSFAISKEYCNSTISGNYSMDGVTDATGFWRPGMIYTYKFENSRDKVQAQFSVVNPKTQETKSESETFRYNDVKDKPAGIKKTYQMILPWTSEEK